jgi:hypothetical protein
MLFHDQVSRKGQSLVEMSAGLMIALPILLLIIEGVDIACGFQFNEQTCREAARVAANGDPAFAAERAKLIVARSNDEKSWMVENERLVSVTNLGNPMNVQPSLGSTPFATVEVVTAVDIKTNFIFLIMPGQKFLTLTSKQSFPYTYVPSGLP